jgi:hypothetical protein
MSWSPCAEFGNGGDSSPMSIERGFWLAQGRVVSGWWLWPTAPGTASNQMDRDHYVADYRNGMGLSLRPAALFFVLWSFLCRKVHIGLGVFGKH